MIRDQQFVLAQYYNRAEYTSFREYLDEQEETLVFFLQAAADNEWHDLHDRMKGASEEEIGAEMERWWKRQIRQFRSRLRDEQIQRRIADLKEGKQRERCRRLQIQDQLQAANEEVAKLCDRVRTLELALETAGIPKPCKCGFLTTKTYCPRCHEELS